MIVNADRMVQSGSTDEDITNLTLYLMEFLLNNCMLPGQVENIFCIIDFDNCGITQVPKGLLQAMIKVLQSNYRGRLFCMYIIRAHWLLRGLWKIAQQFVDPFTI